MHAWPMPWASCPLLRGGVSKPPPPRANHCATMLNVSLAFTPCSLITDVTYLTTEEWANETLQLLATLFVITPFVAISGFFMFKTCASVPRPGSCPAPFQIPPPALPAVHALMLSAVLFGSRSASNSDVVARA